MSDYQKLAFVGDVGSGKSTIIRTLSEIEVVDTDKRATVDIGKEFTTIGIDYGRINFNDSMALGLYGVPGQKRYSLLWEHVNKSLWGLTLLVKFSGAPNTVDLSECLRFFDPVKTGTPFVLGLTHVDEVSNKNVSAVADILKSFLLDHELPGVVIPVNCLDRKSSMMIPYFINSMHNAKAI